MHHRRAIRGFTLIELLAVVTILGILAALAAIGISQATKRARDARRKTDLASLKKAMELYNQDNGNYPVLPSFTAVDAFASPELKAALVTNGSYIAAIPQDPSSSPTAPYKYYLSYDSAAATNLVLYGQLEYLKDKQNAPAAITCANYTDATQKGNGVVNNPPTNDGSGSCKVQFRLTND